MFTTPAGKMSFKISPNTKRLRDVWLEGLITTVQPAARAGANFKQPLGMGSSKARLDLQRQSVRER